MQRTGSIKELRRIITKARSQGRRVALVPTMGYLHEGHLSLVKEAVRTGSFVVMSIFVNPLQFGPKEDFSRYPRALERDESLAEGVGVDLLFHPTVEEMYPEPNLAFVEVGKLDGVLCGASRPGHFRGVATVVSKLFHVVLPDFAFFGQKDYQQYLVIKRMVRDLNFPLEVIAVPTVREEDGLAMSSRNVYLTPEQRAEAVILHRGLTEAAQRIREGVRQARSIEQMIREKISRTSGHIDYVEMRGAEELEEIEFIQGPVVIALAVYFGPTRLIDNTVIRDTRFLALDTPSIQA
ncbi:MAG: pantoate--beta-alanine ligase [Desulfitobacteriaceae bacterium]